LEAEEPSMLEFKLEFEASVGLKGLGMLLNHSGIAATTRKTVLPGVTMSVGNG
jgi:hypothetical protein